MFIELRTIRLLFVYVLSLSLVVIGQCLFAMELPSSNFVLDCRQTSKPNRLVSFSCSFESSRSILTKRSHAIRTVYFRMQLSSIVNDSLRTMTLYQHRPTTHSQHDMFTVESDPIVKVNVIYARQSLSFLFSFSSTCQ
jgi:hypothetical protein